MLCCRALTAADSLPVKRVVLYKNGVGYFEHVGSVRGNGSVTVGFSSSQLNDVLKSLTVLDLGGGRITGVGYGSMAPSNRLLSDAELNGNGHDSIASILEALRGSKIEVRSDGTTIAGRLLGVATQERFVNGRNIETQVASVLTDGGELRSVELTQAVAVRLIESGVNARLGRYLDAVGAAKSSEFGDGNRSMVISTQGQGDRRLFVSYISEVPVWKSTYRISLDAKSAGKATLQAWAIIDNTVGEDWKDVELSLVAGAPQSFVQNLSQPYYAKRPVVGLPEYASTMPQTHEATLTTGAGKIVGVVRDPAGAALSNATVRAMVNDAPIAQSTTDRQGRFVLEGLPPEQVHLAVQALGFQRSNVLAQSGSPEEIEVTLNVGSAAQTVDVMAAQPRVKAFAGTGRETKRPSSAAADAAPVAGLGGSAYPPVPPPPVATGQDLGDLFEYKMDSPISIAKNQSALVPIAQASITTEKVSLWKEGAGNERPQSALWFTNTSKLTFDSGTVSVSEANAFAGEGIVELIRPGEKRLLTYATDLALTVSTNGSTEPQRVTRVNINRGTLHEESELREKKVYTVRNTDSAPRRLIIEEPIRAGYEVRGDTKPVEITAHLRRFALDVGPAATASLTVEEARKIFSSIQVSSITPDQIALFIRQGAIDAGMKSAFDDIVAQQAVVAGLESQKEAREAEKQKINSDQERVRENMKALRGTAEEKALVQRYAAQLNQQETRLVELDKETQALEKQSAAEEEKLTRMIEKLDSSPSR